MTTKEAIHAMIDGKKVTRKLWAKGAYTYAEGVTFYNQNGRILNSFGDRDDWEIYEEPKPKKTVIIEKWLCKSAWENYFIIESEVEFFKTGGYDKEQVKLLDTYEVEL